jgi:hypothetical protein
MAKALFRRLVPLVVSAAITGGVLAGAGGSALASGGSSCWDAHMQRVVPSVGGSAPAVPVEVYRCTLWQKAHVPVYGQAKKGSPVGELTHGGGANWFVFQCVTTDAYESSGSSYNDVWAYTEADNGRWGYVNEVWFAGGGNNQSDPILFGDSSFHCPSLTSDGSIDLRAA